MSGEFKNMLIMCEDTEVISCNFDKGEFIVLNELLIPFPIKGKLRENLSIENIDLNDINYYVSKNAAIMYSNKSAIMSWLANRALSLSRKNAKWLYNFLNVEQVQTDVEKAKISIICRGVSVLDNYWLKLEGDTACWDEVNVRKNKLNEVIAQVALHGKSLSLQGSLISPEFTTNGAYAKSWRRQPDGNLWLYKLGADGDTESRIEVMCSNLLDKMNVKHCHYEAGEDNGRYISMCPCMSSDELSILSGMDFISYCNVNNVDYFKYMMEIDAESIYKMWIIDYLISNRDRHGQNWGFYYNPKTMEIIGCHPLFDHNNAFSAEWMFNRDSDYQFNNMTIRQAAKYAMNRVDFYFVEEINREDFITERQYKEFMWRANDLGIKVKSNPLSTMVEYLTSFKKG